MNKNPSGVYAHIEARRSGWLFHTLDLDGSGTIGSRCSGALLLTDRYTLKNALRNASSLGRTRQELGQAIRKVGDG